MSSLLRLALISQVVFRPVTAIIGTAANVAGSVNDRINRSVDFSDLQSVSNDLIKRSQLEVEIAESNVAYYEQKEKFMKRVDKLSENNKEMLKQRTSAFPQIFPEVS